MKWVCRCWKCSSGPEWLSEFEEFETEAEAIAYGESFVRLINIDETARNFEVYRKFETEEEFEENYGVDDCL